MIRRVLWRIEKTYGDREKNGGNNWEKGDAWIERSHGWGTAKGNTLSKVVCDHWVMERRNNTKKAQGGVK